MGFFAFLPFIVRKSGLNPGIIPFSVPTALYVITVIFAFFGFTVALLYQSKAEAAEYAKKRGQLFDSLLRRVNNKANSTVGDVILSPDGAVIEDYREELEFILPEDQYRSE